MAEESRQLVILLLPSLIPCGNTERLSGYMDIANVFYTELRVSPQGNCDHQLLAVW